MNNRIISGDCRTALNHEDRFDLIIADPPYGDTALDWDRRVAGWERVARSLLAPTGSLWLFGSLRSLMAGAPALEAAGWRMAQDIVWEKHAGSGFQADGFRRVHEIVAQFYPADVRWRDVYNAVPVTRDAKARTVRRSTSTPHAGRIGPSIYAVRDGDPRLRRSVAFCRSCHGRAIHPTEKPVDLLDLLVRTSCPPGGRVGDLFAGSGAAGEASVLAGRSYTGCEIDPVMADKARSRLERLLPFGAAA